uniref:Uncharacterized protein n=1 Tax=viral metagenome TaxID=1070528 RepID=A0A6C0EKI7_9ZZZZ
MSLCKYRNALGKPGKGAHFHVLGIAIVDLLLTIALAFGIYFLAKKRWNFWIILLSLLVLAILVHRLFCVNTTINKLIFGKV